MLTEKKIHSNEIVIGNKTGRFTGFDQIHHSDETKQTKVAVDEQNRPKI